MLNAAASAGLDFVALTDHDTASHWLELDRLQPYYDDLLLLRGRELTTYRGHATTIGEARFTDFRLATPATSPGGVLAGLADAGVFVSISHPALPDDERGMSCGWSDLDAATLAAVHGLEIVNGDAAAGRLAGWQVWAAILSRQVVGGRALELAPPPAAGWHAAVLRNRRGPTAFSNAIYVTRH